MRSLRLLIMIGLLVAGWINRGSLSGLGSKASTTAQETVSNLELPSPAAVLQRGMDGFGASATPHPAREAQAQATALYPGIARANSSLNQKFVALYKEAQTSDPALLARPDWPIQLAERAVISLGGAPMPQAPPANVNAAAEAPRAQSQILAKTQKQIVIYSTSHCPYCTKAKQYFSQKGIRYREVNIESSQSAKEEFRKLGGQGVPLIVVGDEVVRGFSVKTLDRLLL